MEPAISEYSQKNTKCLIKTAFRRNFRHDSRNFIEKNRYSKHCRRTKNYVRLERKAADWVKLIVFRPRLVWRQAGQRLLCYRTSEKQGA